MMTNTIISRLAFIPSFRRAIIDYAFGSQSKAYRENLEIAFHDSNRKIYYRYSDYKKMPLKRLEQITKMQEVIREGMKRGKGTYLAEWIEKGKATIEQSKTPKADFGKLLYALEERSKLFDEDLLIELACLTYIREDENPHEFSETLHQEKINQIKKDLKLKAGGLYDFFQQAGLKDYLPSDVGTVLDYEEFTKVSRQKIERMNQELHKTSSLLSELKE